MPASSSTGTGGPAARLAGWLEQAFNPIMVKELRASMRGARFTIAHLTILGLFAAGLLIIFAGQMAMGRGYGGRDPSVIGQEVFLITQIIQLAVVMVVVPGLAAASITGERETMTHELLVSTTLCARQIVWGKFTASMTQSFTLLVSMIPLVGLCFLFGGVTPYQIIASYAFLFGLSAIMVMFAITISSSARTTPRAVATIYALAALVGSCMTALVVDGVHGPLNVGWGVAYGFLPAQEAIELPLPLFDRVIYVWVMPLFGGVSLFVLFFINAVNRLKPLFANRSTNLRIYFASVLVGAAALFVVVLYGELPLAESTYDRATGLMAFSMSLLSAALMASLFACEEPVLSPGLAAEARRRGLSRMLAPGSGTGTAFAMTCMALVVAGSGAALAPFAWDFSRGAWEGWPPTAPLSCALVTVVVWTWFCVTLGRMLTVWLVDRPLLIRSILVTASIFLAVFPLVHWAIAEAIERDPLVDPLTEHGPVTLLLSPAASILSALEPSLRHRTFPLYAGGVPIPAGFGIVYAVLGACFLWAAQRGMRRFHAGGGP